MQTGPPTPVGETRRALLRRVWYEALDPRETLEDPMKSA